MRDDAACREELLFEREGSSGGGDPADRGSDTQSSDSESSQACSIEAWYIADLQVVWVLQ